MGEFDKGQDKGTGQDQTDEEIIAEKLRVAEEQGDGGGKGGEADDERQ